MLVSQITVIFGRAGLVVKIPFMSLMTNGCDPAGISSTMIKVDSADLAVFIAEYPNPVAKHHVKKFITSLTCGDMVLMSFSPQYVNHFLMYV